MDKTHIYVLKDPTTNEVRYVGKANHPKKRYSKHIRDVERHDPTSHKHFWIRKLLRNNQKPLLEVIETIDMSEWKERECYWIGKYRSEGIRLTNSTDGGDGANISGCKSVVKLDPITHEVLDTYISLAEAARLNGMGGYGRILYCCQGKSLTSGGYKWRYLGEGGELIDPFIKKEFSTKRVVKLDLKLGIIKTYPDLYSIRLDGYDIGNVSKCCNGVFRLIDGSIWRNLDEQGNIIHPEIKYKHKTVSQYSLDGELVDVYENCKQAGEKTNTHPESVRKVCVGHYTTSNGYRWVYNEY
jgi:hypothetical protein